MSTLLKEQTLETTTKDQKKLIIIGSIMIILLSVSNLGTAFLAANLAKDISVIDGRMVTNDGMKSAITTRSSVKAFSVVGREDMDLSDRRLDEDERTIACYTPDEAKDIFNTVREEGRANLVVRDPGSSSIKRILPINIEGQRRMLDISRKLESTPRRNLGEEDAFTIMYEFPGSRVRFVPDDFDCVMDLEAHRSDGVDPQHSMLRTVGVKRRL